MNTNGKEISKEIIAKAVECETPEELMELAESEGIELTKDEAEAYISELADAELTDAELTDAELQQVAGGDDECKGYWKGCYGHCPQVKQTGGIF